MDGNSVRSLVQKTSFLHFDLFVFLPPFLQVFSDLEAVLLQQVLEHDWIHSSLISCDLDCFVLLDRSVDAEGTRKSSWSESWSDERRSGYGRSRGEVDGGRLSGRSCERLLEDCRRGTEK